MNAQRKTSSPAQPGFGEWTSSQLENLFVCAGLFYENESLDHRLLATVFQLAKNQPAPDGDIDLTTISVARWLVATEKAAAGSPESEFRDRLVSRLQNTCPETVELPSLPVFADAWCPSLVNFTSTEVVLPRDFSISTVFRGMIQDFIDAFPIFAGYPDNEDIYLLASRRPSPRRLEQDDAFAELQVEPPTPDDLVDDDWQWVRPIEEQLTRRFRVFLCLHPKVLLKQVEPLTEIQFRKLLKADKKLMADFQGREKVQLRWVREMIGLGAKPEYRRLIARLYPSLVARHQGEKGEAELSAGDLIDLVRINKAGELEVRGNDGGHEPLAGTGEKYRLYFNAFKNEYSSRREVLLSDILLAKNFPETPPAWTEEQLGKIHPCIGLFYDDGRLDNVDLATAFRLVRRRDEEGGDLTAVSVSRLLELCREAWNPKPDAAAVGRDRPEALAKGSFKKAREAEHLYRRIVSRLQAVNFEEVLSPALLDAQRLSFTSSEQPLPELSRISKILENAILVFMESFPEFAGPPDGRDLYLLRDRWRYKSQDKSLSDLGIGISRERKRQIEEQLNQRFRLFLPVHPSRLVARLEPLSSKELTVLLDGFMTSAFNNDSGLLLHWLRSVLGLRPEGTVSSRSRSPLKILDRLFLSENSPYSCRKLLDSGLDEKQFDELVAAGNLVRIFAVDPSRNDPDDLYTPVGLDSKTAFAHVLLNFRNGLPWKQVLEIIRQRRLSIKEMKSAEQHPRPFLNEDYVYQCGGSGLYRHVNYLPIPKEQWPRVVDSVVRALSRSGAGADVGYPLADLCRELREELFPLLQTGGRTGPQPLPEDSKDELYYVLRYILIRESASEYPRLAFVAKSRADSVRLLPGKPTQGAGR